VTSEVQADPFIVGSRGSHIDDKVVRQSATSSGARGYVAGVRVPVELMEVLPVPGMLERHVQAWRADRALDGPQNRDARAAAPQLPGVFSSATMGLLPEPRRKCKSADSMHNARAIKKGFA